jgi:hypothetical protein
MSMRLANRSSGATGNHNFGKIRVPLHYKTRLYMICKTSLVSAVVAQPGRALDLFRGEAEDRAVVSSNLTDGTSHLFYSISGHDGDVINNLPRCSQMVLGIEYCCQFLF